MLNTLQFWKLYGISEYINISEEASKVNPPRRHVVYVYIYIEMYTDTHTHILNPRT